MKNGNSKNISDLKAAYREWLRRQDRKSYPEGGFLKGRWYPNDAEKCDCCEKLKGPTRAYPYTLLAHCKTQKHVAHLFGVDRRSFGRYIASRERERKAQSSTPIPQIAEQAEKERIAKKIATAIVESLTPEQRRLEILTSNGYSLF